MLCTVAAVSLDIQRGPEAGNEAFWGVVDAALALSESIWALTVLGCTGNILAVAQSPPRGCEPEVGECEGTRSMRVSG